MAITGITVVFQLIILADICYTTATTAALV